MTQLQAHADTLARRALGLRGWGAVTGDNNKTSVPSRWVRAELGLWTIESNLQGVIECFKKDEQQNSRKWILNNLKQSPRGTEKKTHAKSMSQKEELYTTTSFCGKHRRKRVQMRMRNQFHEQTSTSTPPTEETPESRHENSSHRVHTTTVQHTNHAKTMVSKHVRSSVTTEESQFSEYGRNRDCANETQASH